MKYQVISATKPAELEKLVNQEIENDWVPLGGVACTEHILVQAMILEDKAGNLQ